MRGTITSAGERSGPLTWRLPKRAVTAGAAAAAMLLAAGGAAIASDPGTGPKILHGCYASRTGALRLLTAPGQSCTAGEKAVSWNEAGITWEGRWRRATSYRAGVAVTYQGSSYLATAASIGSVPSPSSGTWQILAAAGAPGDRGAAGPSGPPGPAGSGGGALGYAEYYAIPTNPVPVIPGEAISFGHDGPAAGSVVARHGCVTRNTDFSLIPAGTWEVTFQVPVQSQGVLGLSLNGQLIDYTIAGTDTESQIVGEALITAGAGSVLAVINPPNSLDTFTIAGTLQASPSPLSDWLVIKLLSAGTGQQAPVLGQAPGRHAVPSRQARQFRRQTGC